MQETTIWHNPRCAKSRETLQLLQQKGLEPSIFQYLKEPISEQELRDVLSKLDIQAEDLLRKKEPIFREQFKDKEYSQDEWVQIMIENPKLIERPIVVTKKGAAIGRPAEQVLSIL